MSERRLQLGHGRFCSRACRDAAHVTHVPRVCEQCGTAFAAYRYLVNKGFGRFCSRNCANAAARKPADLPPRRLVAARDGDRSQARRRVRTAVQGGYRPHADTLPCADCGHVWQPGESHHQYDHHLGYAPEHQEDVEAVCTKCHYKRTIARGERHPRSPGHG